MPNKVTETELSPETFDLEPGDELYWVKNQEAHEAERRSLAEFAVGANLAHNLAYGGHNQVFTIADEDKVLREYQTIPMVSGHQAIQAEMYVPSENNDQSIVYVNFRGTCDAPTLHADLERNAGEQVFHRKKKQIMEQIAKVVSEVEARTGKPVTLHIAGHSLGGALAQHTLNETLRYSAENVRNETTDEKIKKQIEDADKVLVTEIEKHNSSTDNTLSPEVLEAFKKVDTVKLSTWNSTGVSKEVQRYSNEISDVLLTQGQKIQARFGMIGGDFVQQTGEGTVLSDCNADVKVLKLDLGYEGFANNLLKSFLVGAGSVAAGLMLGPLAAGIFGTVGFLLRAGMSTGLAHTSPSHCFEDNILCKENAGILYEKNTNETPEGRARIKRRLQNKSELLQAAPILALKEGLHSMAKGCSRMGLTGAVQGICGKINDASESASQFVSYFKKMF